MTGANPVSFYKDAQFYLVLIVGISVQISLSTFVLKLEQEHNKLNIRKMADKEIDLIRVRIEELQLELDQLLGLLEQKKAELAIAKQRVDQFQFRSGKVGVSKHDLERRIRTFQSGWLIAIANLPAERKAIAEQESQQILTQFISENLD